jgi:hypothetical protein
MGEGDLADTSIASKYFCRDALAEGTGNYSAVYHVYYAVTVRGNKGISVTNHDL